MKKIWNGWLKESIFVYCVVYTVATVANSVLYLVSGVLSDPNGNWHEIDRAWIVLIGVAAYELAAKLPMKNTALKMLGAYLPTMALALLYVYTTSFREPLAPSAYRDIFVNYTGLFLILSVITAVAGRKRKWS